jgi:hypothetical protein
MTVEEFWNRAYLAALARCDPERAKQDADRALEHCIEQWQSHRQRWSGMPVLWKNQDVADVPKFREEAGS